MPPDGRTASIGGCAYNIGEGIVPAGIVGGHSDADEAFDWIASSASEMPPADGRGEE